MTHAKAIPKTITIHVPFRLVKRGGRKEMVLPPEANTRRNVNDALVKALARAFRWKRMLDSGAFSTIADLAQRERIAAPFLTRTMRLAQLAPDLVEAILDGRQPRGLTLEALREPLPSDWSEQRRHLTIAIIDDESG
jgi:hypothetical protein